MKPLKRPATERTGLNPRRQERIAQILLPAAALLLAACGSGRQRTVGNSAPENPEAQLVPNTEVSAISWPADSVAVIRGRVVLAHEVRSFIPEGDTVEYWIVDRSGALEREYNRVTGGIMNGQPVQAELKVRYKGYSDEGFAADYEGVFEMVEIRSVEKAEK